MDLRKIKCKIISVFTILIFLKKYFLLLFIRALHRFLNCMLSLRKSQILQYSVFLIVGFQNLLKLCQCLEIPCIWFINLSIKLQKMDIDYDNIDWYMYVRVHPLPLVIWKNGRTMGTNHMYKQVSLKCLSRSDDIYLLHSVKM